MTHAEFLSTLLRTIRAEGAASTLEQVRNTRPAFHPIAPGARAYHDTLAVFYVWAVDRLVAGGLSDFGVMWHPLVDARSPQVWWTPATLASPDAMAHFQPSELAREGEPQPVEAVILLAA